MHPVQRIKTSKAADLKLITFIVLVLFISINTRSQVNIKGIILDEEHNPVQYANVVLLQPSDSMIVKGTVSNEKGWFELNDIASADYLLMVSMIGYQKLYLPNIQITEAEKQDVDPITLLKEINELNEAVIIAQRPLLEVMADRLVVNVQSSANASSATALEMLERSPGVMVDKSSGSIEINGKTGVRVMINGKMSLMPLDAVYQMLDGTPASSIDRIEILTTPPAKYDAEGDAGFINIVMLKNPQTGINGALSGILGYGEGEKLGANGNINYRSEKLNIFASYSYNYSKFYEYIANQREVILADTIYQTRGFSYRYPELTRQYINAGIDYSLSSRTMVGILFNAYDRYWRQHSDFSGYENSVPGEITSNQGIMLESNRAFQYIINANLQHAFKNDRSLNIDFDYLNRSYSQPQSYETDFFNERDELLYRENKYLTKDTPLEIYASKIDYTHLIGRRIYFETGLEAAYSDFINRTALEIEKINGSSESFSTSATESMEERIGAAYFLVRSEISEHFNLSGGLRYEYSSQEIEAENEKPEPRIYSNIFPSFFLTKDFMTDHTFQISINTRILRPSFSDLAPFVYWIDPYSVMTGNINLQPSFTSNYKLSYLYKKNFVTFEHSRIRNSIARWQPITDNETDRTTYTTINLDRVNENIRAIYCWNCYPTGGQRRGRGTYVFL
jgi:hypothetical protein